MAVPKYLRGPLPIVSYTYTRTIAGEILNKRKVVNEWTFSFKVPKYLIFGNKT